MKRLTTIFIAISIFSGIIFLKLSMISCTPKIKQYERTNDWHNGYREGHRDGRYIGYKIKEMESKEKTFNNEVIHESD